MKPTSRQGIKLQNVLFILTSTVRIEKGRSSKNLNAIIEVTKATMKSWNFDLYQQTKKELSIKNQYEILKDLKQ
jgi:hypothetical protein